MQVSKDRISQYRKELDSAADDAAEFMSDYYDALKASHPNASVAELRNMAIKSIKQALNAFSPQAGELAGELFDEIVKAEKVDAKFRYQPTIEQSLVEKKVHYLAKDLVDGNSQKFIDACSTLTRFYVHREANINMYRSAAHSNIRWARVPSGTETCGWCFMLSTRGFDYTSESKAGGLGHKFHLHCDCIIVPGTKKTVIEGYDPKAMYSRWVECANTIGLKPTFKNRHAIIAECERRDFRWLYNGISPEIHYIENYGEKNEVVRDYKFARNKVAPHEYITAQRMRQLGLTVDFIKDHYSVDLPNGSQVIVGRCDMTNGYELKAPRESTSVKNLVSNSIENSKNKEGIKRLIIDVTDNPHVSINDVIPIAVDYCNKYKVKFTVSILEGSKLKNAN
ncbi:MAG: hypothetical protein HXK61_00040 [Atopobiaceae bacterium]|nr:hypothetical protein [Atopobiaceae bacterium]